MPQFQHRRWTTSAASLKSERSNAPCCGSHYAAQAHLHRSSSGPEHPQHTGLFDHFVGAGMQRRGNFEA